MTSLETFSSVTDTDAGLCFLSYVGARRGVEGEGKSCRLPLSTTHVPVLAPMSRCMLHLTCLIVTTKKSCHGRAWSLREHGEAKQLALRLGKAQAEETNGGSSRKEGIGVALTFHGS